MSGLFLTKTNTYNLLADLHAVNLIASTKRNFSGGFLGGSLGRVPHGCLIPKIPKVPQILLQRLPTCIKDWWPEDPSSILSGHLLRHLEDLTSKTPTATIGVGLAKRICQLSRELPQSQEYKSDDWVPRQIDAKCFLGVPWGRGRLIGLLSSQHILKYRLIGILSSHHGFEDAVTRGAHGCEFGQALLLDKWHNSQLANIKRALWKRPSDTSLQNSQDAERKLDNMKVNHAVPPEWGFQYLHGGEISKELAPGCVNKAPPTLVSSAACGKHGQRDQDIQ